MPHTPTPTEGGDARVGAFSDQEASILKSVASVSPAACRFTDREDTITTSTAASPSHAEQDPRRRAPPTTTAPGRPASTSSPAASPAASPTGAACRFSDRQAQVINSVATTGGANRRAPPRINCAAGLAFDLYYYLQHKDAEGRRPRVNVPHTVLFQQGNPTSWYFTSHKQGGVVLRRKRHHTLESHIELALCGSAKQNAKMKKRRGTPDSQQPREPSEPQESQSNHNLNQPNRQPLSQQPPGGGGHGGGGQGGGGGGPVGTLVCPATTDDDGTSRLVFDHLGDEELRTFLLQPSIVKPSFFMLQVREKWTGGERARERERERESSCSR